MRKSILGLLPLAVVVLLMSAAPVSAFYPQTRCDHETVGGSVILPDGERWRCEYDEELDDCFWFRSPPFELPTDTLVWNRHNWTAPDGVIHHVRARLGWVRRMAAGSSFTPTFTWGSAPCGARWYVALAFAAHWDGVKWVNNTTSVSTQYGTTLGDPKYATSGMLWDANDDRKPSKPPKEAPKNQGANRFDPTTPGDCGPWMIC
jgi:hypothetical protein